jgi:hypothetical protein
MGPGGFVREEAVADHEPDAGDIEEQHHAGKDDDAL